MKRAILFIGLLSEFFLFTDCARAQAPNITYTPTTNVFTVGSAITALNPGNTGGAVPATTYATVSTLVNTGTFNNPQAVATDGTNIYVASLGDNRIRKITPGGVVSILAGSGAAAEADGLGLAAKFNQPDGLAYDGAGNLYVSDAGGNTIRKIVISTGLVSTYAGTGASSPVINSTPLASTFNGPAGLDIDASGNMYICDQGSHTIRMISGGVVSTLAGTAGTSGSNNAVGTAATFYSPNDLVADNHGNLFVADYLNNQIRKIVISTKTVTTFAGSATQGSTDGTGTAATFTDPASICLDASGNLVIADLSNKIRLITPAAVVTTIAGSGAATETNGVGTAAALYSPGGVATDNSGNLYVIDFEAGNSTSSTLRKILLTGYVISPALPAALTFTSSSGQIAGTPTALSAVTSYTITGYNASGSSSATITIQCVQTNNWTAGANTTAWGTAANWSKNAVPGVNDDVQIGVTAYTNNQQPTLSATTAVHSITFGAVKAGILTISSGNTLTLNGYLTVNTASTGTIIGGAASSTVDMAPASIVNVNGTGVLTLTNPLTFNLQSSAAGDASIGQVVSGAITGTAASAINVQRYLTGGSATYRGYRLLSSPVYASTVAGNKVYSINYLKNSIYLTATTTLGSGGFDNTSAANPTLYLYRENLNPSYTTFTGSNFRGINNINASPSYTIDLDGSGFNIPVGNGYLCFFRGNRASGSFATETSTSYVPQTVTLSTSGTLNIGQFTVHDWFTAASPNLSYTAGSPVTVRGFNLVGNPYASAINWDNFQSSSTTTGIYGSGVGSTIYVLDPVSHNYGAYIAGNLGAGGTNNATNIISSGQGFFVITSATTAQLIFNESAKTVTQNTGTHLLMGTPVNLANNQFLKLRLFKDSVNADETVIRFNSNGSTNFNPSLDAPYKGGYGSVSLSGISSDNISLAIDVIPLPHAQPESVSLNVTANTDGAYTISLKDLVSVPQLYDLWLIDKYKKDTTNLRQNTSYTFNIAKADTASYGANRFKLVIGQNPAFACQLLSFTGSKMQGSRQVQLVWNTQNEGNYTNYTVERSIDGGKTFAVLGAVPATGSGKYSLQDQNPIIGSNLYRLKQVDVNNVITYSNVVTIAYSDLSNNLANNLMLFPNPAVNTLSLNLVTPPVNNLSSYNIRFMNSSGLIIKQVTSAQPSWQGSINNLQPGTYIVQVLNSSTSSLVGQGKFVKL